MKAMAFASRSGGLKIVAVMFLLAVASSLSAYAYHLYNLFKDAQRHIPQPQIDRLLKDFRQFHSRNHRFPRNFVEIDTEIWRTNPKPDYGVEGRQARTKNYYYFYTIVNARQFALWAVPTGPRREDGYAYFLVVTKEWFRIWRGKAIDESVVPILQAIPSRDELSKLGLNELLKYDTTPKHLLTLSRPINTETGWLEIKYRSLKIRFIAEFVAQSLHI